MTEKECSTKLLVFKVLSIVCLLVVVLSGFLPWISMSGDYKDSQLGALSQMADQIPEEELETYQEFLEEEGVDYDLEGMVDCIDSFMDPVMDGQISPMDFMTLSQNTGEMKGYMEGAAEIDMGTDSLIMSEEDAQMFDILSFVFIVPAIAYGLVAVVALIRAIMHLSNRKGMGIGVVILSVIVTGFYVLIALLFQEVFLSDVSATASITAVPVVAVVCAILNCVFWAIGRKYIHSVVVEKVVEVAPEDAPPVPQNMQ